MGILDAISGDRIYLDTNIWIYAIEGYTAFVQPLTELLTAIDQGSLRAITSELTLAEVMVKPLINQNQPQQAAYQKALRPSTSVEIIAVSRAILLEAANVRASSPLKLPDAIHAATAMTTQCTTFLTNDQRFQSVSSLNALLLSQVTSP